MLIQPLSSRDRSAWADLLAQAFDRSPSQMADLLDWLTRNFELIAYGVWEADRLVAQYSVLLREMYDPVGCRYFNVGLSFNMAVHADYRGQGLIKKVSTPVYEALHLQGGLAGVGFSNAMGVQVDRHSTGYGYQVIGQLQSVLGLIRPVRADPLELTDRWPLSLVADPPHEPTRLQFYNTPDWLYRRFACHPFRTYRYGIWAEGDHLKGVIVYRPIEVGRWAGVGFGLLAAYVDPSIRLADLITRWTSALLKTGGRFVHLLTSPTGLLRTALRQSTVALRLPASRTPYYFTVKPLDPQMSASLLDFSSLDCTGGDIL